MRPIPRLLGPSLVVLAGCADLSAASNQSFRIPPESSQLVVVRSADWAAAPATLTRHRRRDGVFVADGEPIPVVLGRSGLGWGLGLHPEGLEGPVKQEGDGRAPAGVFELGEAMGYLSAAPGGSRWPYQSSTGRVCVDDPASPFYNRIVGPEVPPGWKSAEKMVRNDSLYEWLVLVRHNPKPVAGAGSCIFLHVWRATDKPTVGCTATDADALLGLIGWLEPAALPLLVQLPEEVYRGVAQSWGLPP